MMRTWCPAAASQPCAALLPITDHSERSPVADGSLTSAHKSKVAFFHRMDLTQPSKKDTEGLPLYASHVAASALNLKLAESAIDQWAGSSLGRQAVEATAEGYCDDEHEALSQLRAAHEGSSLEIVMSDHVQWLADKDKVPAEVTRILMPHVAYDPRWLAERLQLRPDMLAHLQMLNISHTARGASMRPLLQMLLPTKGIVETTQEETNVEDDDDDNEGAVPEAPIVPPALKALSSLLLSGNENSFAEGDDEESTLDILQKALKIEGSNLVELAIASCGLDSNDIAKIATGLKTNRNIRVLDMAGSNLGRGGGAEAVADLSDMLRYNKYLLALSLSDCGLNSVQCAQITEALENSNTRAPTPPPEPDIEPEPFDDEIPEEEERPNVTVGLPVPESKKPAVADEYDLDSTKLPGERADDDEEEVDEADNEPPAVASIEKYESETQLFDAEGAEEGEEEVLDEEALAAREAEWREAMTTHVWSPQLVLEEYDESCKRRSVWIEWLSATRSLKEEEQRAKVGAKESQRSRERVDRMRISGYTHIRVLDLSFNRLGNKGAKAIARILRSKVPLSAEEVEELNSKFEADKEAAQANAVAAFRQQRLEHHASNVEESHVMERNLTMTTPTFEALSQPRRNSETVAEEDESNDGESQATIEEKGDPFDGAVVDEVGAEDAAAVEEELIMNEAAASIPRPLDYGISGICINTLDLSHCSIGPSGASAIFKVLERNNNSVRDLRVGGNPFATRYIPDPQASPREVDDEDDAGDEKATVPQILDVRWVSPAVRHLAAAVAAAAGLTALDVSRTSICAPALAVLAASLFERPPQTSLRSLRLAGNPLTDGDDGNGMENLMAAVVAANVEVLDLSGCGIGGCLGCGMAALCRSGLRELDISRNHWQLREMQRLATLVGGEDMNVRMTSTLRSLRITHAKISPAILPHLQMFVSKCTHLEDFDASFNEELGEGDANAFVAALPQSLKALRLRQVNLKLSEELGGTMAKMHALRILDIADNPYSLQSAGSFTLKALTLPRLQHFSLWNRRWSDSEIDIVATIVLEEYPPSLLSLDLGIVRSVPLSHPGNAVVQSPRAIPLRFDAPVIPTTLDKIETDSLRRQLSRLQGADKD